MTTFIEDVLNDLKRKKLEFSELVFILPSKRAGTFLKYYISQSIEQPVFSPSIYSIEEFVEELSDLKSVSNIELLFNFYKSYLKVHTTNNVYSFEEFSKWAQVLIQDFNEIDRHLIPQNNIFDYLSAIKEVNHWSVESNKTELINRYLTFWKRLKNYYFEFKDALISEGKAYQGLIYREAVENIQSYIENSSTKKHVFLGFNALNTAEETIIQEILQNDLGYIYWDIDHVFYESKNHDVALFIKQYSRKWNFFKNKPFNWVSNNYSKEKNIQVYGIPKNVGQAKYIGTILSDLQKSNNSLNSTAIILSDETLLLPVLNSIPKNVNALNVTMGLELKTVPLASLFEKLFSIQKKKSASFYYKDIISILSHEFVNPLFNVGNSNKVSEIIYTIQSNNIVYLDEERLQKLSPKNEHIISVLFSFWQDNAKTGLQKCQDLILLIKSSFKNNKQDHVLALEYLFRFHELFNEIEQLNESHNYVNDIGTLHSVYNELLSSETLDFKGEPLEGLQIMGMLESRVLDFETVIISSVNEGILPSGKTQNSFIPFDVKVENKLPTYKEKDAIYAYHFYKILNRAKNVFILYNTEIDTLSGGEKSRFIKQLEIENIHNIKHSLVAPKVPKTKKDPNKIYKTPDVLSRLKQISEDGFSPSSLTTYVRNPLDFYYKKILKIKEYDDVEETIAANTLGTVIHNTLEDFYAPFVGLEIHVQDVELMKPQIEETVTRHFKSLYMEGYISKGKNLIIFEIAKRYILNFLDLELTDLKNGNTIKILAIESENKIPLDFPEIDFPVFLKGTVDRVDKRNGVIRIIDYKSGKVDKGKVEVVNWEDITTDYDKYSKSFQVLSYALMMEAYKKPQEQVEAGIISFKNLNQGFLKFAKKDRAGSYAKKIEYIDQEILADFTRELKQLIIEICNPKVPFIEKEI
ncbi:PD-(D/E)XK nuclease family protein [Hanstruepera marina]|uniref:PD-(D/E)XK nuclease family protein n=1 Tax=Hanstruepera marina TaxID=2873265 RepID=UPI001CA61DC6|nr:PD-(D/E)XK nuclease family protein [Hanstruepera marina]